MAALERSILNTSCRSVSVQTSNKPVQSDIKRILSEYPGQQLQTPPPFNVLNTQSYLKTSYFCVERLYFLSDCDLQKQNAKYVVNVQIFTKQTDVMVPRIWSRDFI